MSYIKKIEKLTLSYKRKLKDKFGNEYKLLGLFNDKAIDIIHTSCGHQFSRNPNYFLYYGECPECRKKKNKDKRIKKRIKKANEFKALVKELEGDNYTVLGEIFNPETRTILARHNKCGYEWGMNEWAFKKGRRCPRCARTSFKEPALYKKEFEKVSMGKFELITPYKKSTEKVWIRHLEGCKETFSAMPGYFVKDPRCPVCQKQSKDINSLIDHN